VPQSDSGEQSFVAPLQQWSYSEGRLLREIGTSGNSYSSNVRLTPDGRFLVLLNRTSMRLEVYDPRAGDLLYSLPASDSLDVNLTESGRAVIFHVGEGFGRLQAWDLYKHEVLWEITGSFISLSPDGRLMLYYGAEAGTGIRLCLFDIVEKRRRWMYPDYLAYHPYLEFTPDSTQLLMCMQDEQLNSVRVLDALSGKELKTIPDPLNTRATATPEFANHICRLAWREPTSTNGYFACFQLPDWRTLDRNDPRVHQAFPVERDIDGLESNLRVAKVTPTLDVEELYPNENENTVTGWVDKYAAALRIPEIFATYTMMIRFVDSTSRRRICSFRGPTWPYSVWYSVSEDGRFFALHTHADGGRSTMEFYTIPPAKPWIRIVVGTGISAALFNAVVAAIFRIRRGRTRREPNS
jgi:hypothetical protein